MLDPSKLKPGEEQSERFESDVAKDEFYQYDYQYDYRHTNGKLFSCIGRTLDVCRTARDVWIEKNKDKGGAV